MVTVTAWIFDDSVNHNKFFGTHYDRELEFNVAMQNPTKIKILQNIELDTDEVISPTTTIAP